MAIAWGNGIFNRKMLVSIYFIPHVHLIIRIYGFHVSMRIRSISILQLSNTKYLINFNDRPTIQECKNCNQRWGKPKYYI